MKILALDTATSACSVAVRIDGETIAGALEPMTRGQSEVLMPMLMGVLDQAGMSVSDADLIAVTRGPGAFTGIRIGLAAARGLAVLPQRKPLPLRRLTQKIPIEQFLWRLIQNGLIYMYKFLTHLAP